MYDSKRFVLLTVAVVAIGVFLLPGTVSLFAGQHVWYNISGNANEIPCKKCHADVYEEMSSLANGAHTRMNNHCEFCHRTCFNNTYNWNTGKYEPSSSITYASGEGSGSTPGKESHAVATIECMDCHGVYKDMGIGGGHWNHMMYPEYEDRCMVCHWSGTSWDFISAGGFGFGTTDDDDPDKNPDAGKYAAHKKFVLDALNDTTLAGSNEACIACHTNMAVKINWTHARSLQWDVGIGTPQTTSSGVHNWTMSKWSTNGTAKATVWGNTSGNGSTSYHGNWPGNVDSIYR